MRNDNEAQPKLSVRQLVLLTVLAIPVLYCCLYVAYIYALGIMALVYLDGRPSQPYRPGEFSYGFVDESGKLAIPLNYADVGDFKEGLAAADYASPEHKNEYHWGYLDKRGRWAIDPKFDSACDFSQGLAFVVKNQQGLYIDKTGKVVIPGPFFDGKPFSCGVAIVNNSEVIDNTGHILAKSINFAKMYAVNAERRTSAVARPMDQNGFSEGLAIAGGDWDGKFAGCSYVDKYGRSAVPNQWDEPAPFQEGLARVSGSQTASVYGFIDKTGRFVIPPTFENASSFSEGLAAVKSQDSELYGYIDKAGNYVIPPRFKIAGDFHEGIAAVANPESNKFAYINRQGEMLTDYAFECANDVHSGIALVESTQFLALRKGSYVCKRFQICRDFSDGLAAVGIPAAASKNP